MHAGHVNHRTKGERLFRLMGHEVAKVKVHTYMHAPHVSTLTIKDVMATPPYSSSLRLNQSHPSSSIPGSNRGSAHASSLHFA